MRKNILKIALNHGFIPALAALALAACSSNSASSSAGGCNSTTACCTFPTNMDTSIVSAPTSSNTATATMTLQLGCGYINEPCVSVTICEPGSTSRCQTIPNILLDTGSYGLRLFSCAVKLNLATETTTSGREVAECVSYADGSSDWGPVKTADIYLGTQVASNAGIQYIDSNYSSAPSSCSNIEDNPSLVGFNGILGVGLFDHDCGTGCIGSTNNGIYYSCASGSCTPSSMPLAKQVPNPVSLLSTGFNNGVSLDFTSFTGTSAVTASGIMTIGIPTTGSASGVGSYAADSIGNFRTSFNGNNYGTSVNNQAFIDSGSNGLFFPAPNGLTACPLSGSAAGFFCPTSTQNYTANVGSAGSSPSTPVSFSISNASAMLDPSNPNYVFTQIGGNMSGSFDWGLPFFLGRKVYVQIEGSTSSIYGTGSLWAF